MINKSLNILAQMNPKKWATTKNGLSPESPLNLSFFFERLIDKTKEIILIINSNQSIIKT